uniref:SET domain-containing protein n=1 Tax=Globodera pallida TaxID=36090 RepID=A0A183C2Q1_GLOPA
MIVADLADGKEAVAIPVINTVDNSDIPYAFHYMPKNVDRIPRSVAGCSCVDGCKPKTCECIQRSSIKITPDRKINLRSGFPDFYHQVLFECDKNTCKGCRGKCEWRLTPEQFDKRVELFKTPKAGWGVRSQQFIETGEFVAEFVGEVVTDILQEHRPLEYTYKLTLESSKVDIYIDPYLYGNITRFFNHSCFENLQPFRFYSSHRDMSRGSIGFFASRDILPGHELTIDYGEDWWRSNIKDAASRGHRLYCHCDWVCCLMPWPGKLQMEAEEARKERKRVLFENHRTLMLWKKGEKDRVKILTTQARKN